METGAGKKDERMHHPYDPGKSKGKGPGQPRESNRPLILPVDFASKRCLVTNLLTSLTARALQVHSAKKPLLGT